MEIHDKRSMGGSNQKILVGGVMVLYNPGSNIKDNVESIMNQLGILLIVDNSAEDHSCTFEEYRNVIYKPLLQNVGIAKAQNIALNYLIDFHVNHVLFIDQDSVPSPKLVTHLLSTYEWLNSQGIKVGAVAPLGIDVFTSQPFNYESVSIGEINNGTHHLIEVFQTMSSMSLVSMDTLKTCGLMRDTLFIDGVDSEWCWRATYIDGSRHFYDRDITMQHTLGLNSYRIANHNIHITPPFRLYYQIRNYIWLSKLNYTPSKWKRTNRLKYITKFFFYMIFEPNRKLYFKNFCKGLKDGIKGEPIILNTQQ